MKKELVCEKKKKNKYINFYIMGTYINVEKRGIGEMFGESNIELHENNF